LQAFITSMISGAPVGIPHYANCVLKVSEVIKMWRRDGSHMHDIFRNAEF